MSYREHPGLYEPPPDREREERYWRRWLDGGSRAIWLDGAGGAHELSAEREAWERRHAPELERRAYEASQ